MLLPTQFVINDPFPLTLRRVQPPSPADLEMDSWKILSTPKQSSAPEAQAPQRARIDSDLFTEAEVDRYWKDRAQTRTYYSHQTPPRPGVYWATKNGRNTDSWMRFWNGAFWSHGWKPGASASAIGWASGIPAKVKDQLEIHWAFC